MGKNLWLSEKGAVCVFLCVGKTLSLSVTVKGTVCACVCVCSGLFVGD